jgi:hypothetical protein
MSIQFQSGTGRNLEAACKSWKRWTQERIVRVACVTCGGPVEVKGSREHETHACSPGCQQAARDERESG